MSARDQLFNAMIGATVRSEEAARLMLGDLVSALIALDVATAALRASPNRRALRAEKKRAQARVARVREEAKRFLEQGRA